MMPYTRPLPAVSAGRVFSYTIETAPLIIDANDHDANTPFTVIGRAFGDIVPGTGDPPLAYSHAASRHLFGDTLIRPGRKGFTTYTLRGSSTARAPSSFVMALSDGRIIQPDTIILDTGASTDPMVQTYLATAWFLCAQEATTARAGRANARANGDPDDSAPPAWLYEEKVLMCERLRWTSNHCTFQVVGDDIGEVFRRYDEDLMIKVDLSRWERRNLEYICYADTKRPAAWLDPPATDVIPRTEQCVPQLTGPSTSSFITIATEDRLHAFIDVYNLPPSLQP